MSMIRFRIGLNQVSVDYKIYITNFAFDCSNCYQEERMKERRKIVFPLLTIVSQKHGREEAGERTEKDKKRHMYT